MSVIGTTWMAEMAGMNGFQATPASVNSSDFYAGQWDTTKYKGTSFGVPFIAEHQAVYYRTDLTAKAGIRAALAADWAGYLKDLKAIQATVGKQNPELRYASGWSIGFNSWLFWLPMVWQQGGDIYDAKTGKFTFDSPEVAKALEYYASIPQQGMAPTDRTDSLQGFRGRADRHLPGGLVGRRHLPQGRLEAGRQVEDHARCRSATQSAGFAGGSDLAVFKNAKNPDAAWKFAEFLTEPANLAAYAKATGNLPPSPQRVDGGKLSEDETMQAYGTQLKVSKAPPAITTWQQIADAIDSELEKLALGKATVAQVQQALQSKATSIGTGR